MKRFQAERAKKREEERKKSKPVFKTGVYKLEGTAETFDKAKSKAVAKQVKATVKIPRSPVTVPDTPKFMRRGKKRTTTRSH
jgi:hypothetical protein